MQTWQLYERKELVLLVDTALNGDFDAERACKFLKIGLLCTQDSPKLRPSMSSVVRMLTGEKDFDEDSITKPGLISDFMDLKIRTDPKPKPGAHLTSSNFNSSGSDTMENTTFTSAPSSHATMSFTAVYDRSPWIQQISHCLEGYIFSFFREKNLQFLVCLLRLFSSLLLFLVLF